MKLLFIEGLCLAATLPLLFVGTEFSQHLTRRLRNRLRSQCIGHIVRMLILPHKPTESAVLSLQQRFSQRTITEALLYITSHIYGKEHLRIASIVEILELENKILHSAKRKRGASREAKFALLAQLPITTCCFEELERIIEERNSTYAIAAIITSHPEKAIRYCTRISRTLSHYEVAIIANLLRIHGAPVAYTPLLQSENENLQLIGLYLVEQLSMIDAEPLLHTLLSSSNIAIATHALRVLCTIHGKLPRRNTASLMARMTPFQRDSFVRHAVQRCYAPHACDFALTDNEKLLFHAKIETYKCRILCN